MTNSAKTKTSSFKTKTSKQNIKQVYIAHNNCQVSTYWLHLVSITIFWSCLSLDAKILASASLYIDLLEVKLWPRICLEKMLGYDLSFGSALANALGRQYRHAMCSRT